MNKELFIEKYVTMKIQKKDIESYIKTITDFETYVGKDIAKTNISDIKQYIVHLTNKNQNNYLNIIHIARYYYYIDKKEEYIHMTQYFNSIGVLENIIDRISLLETPNLKEIIQDEITLPEFGADPNDLPQYTKVFMEKLTKHIPIKNCQKILAGNNHRIPNSSFDNEKKFYEASVSLETYLTERHNRKVKELEYYYENNLVWFEQIITKESIDFVRKNQEILSGVIKNNKLYVTKIPYNLELYLNAKTDKEKKYHACHCSFVKESILTDATNVPKEWCYCSGGFAKYPFEVILNQELHVTLLNTPLDGDIFCRFEISLDGVEYKK